MHLLCLFKAELPNGHTMPMKLVYARDLEIARRKAEKLFNIDYGQGFKIRDSATRVFTDVIECQNNIGPGMDIIGTLYQGDLLRFLRDFSRSNTKRRHGSGLHKQLLDELKRQEALEKKRQTDLARLRATEQKAKEYDEGGRDFDSEEKQLEGIF